MAVGKKRERIGNGYGWSKKKCDICPEMFSPKSPQHKHCSKRCAYIARKLSYPAARTMDREVAVAFYASQYDDPLRHVRRGWSRQTVRHIMNYCEKYEAEKFTRRDLEEYVGAKIKLKTMEQAVRDTPALTIVHHAWRGGTIDTTGHTHQMDTYRFRKEDLVLNKDAESMNKREYHEQ